MEKWVNKYFTSMLFWRWSQNTIYDHCIIGYGPLTGLNVSRFVFTPFFFVRNFLIGFPEMILIVFLHDVKSKQKVFFSKSICEFCGQHTIKMFMFQSLQINVEYICGNDSFRLTFKIIV